MAITYQGDLGQAANKTKDTSTAIAYAGATKPQAGDLVVVYGSRDNIDSDPATGDSFADTDSNTYTAIAVGQNTTTAGSGQVTVLFYSVLTTTFSAGTNTLTWTYPATAAGAYAKAVRVEYFRGAGTLRASGSTTGTSGTGAPSAANTTPVNGDLVVGCCGAEDTNAVSMTGDSDTTNGSWSTIVQFGSTGAGAATNQKVGHQYKIVNATGTQTFNGTVGTSTDSSAIIAVFAPAGYAALPGQGAAGGCRVVWYEGFDLPDASAVTSLPVGAWGSATTGCTVATQNSGLRFTTAGTTGGYAEVGGAYMGFRLNVGSNWEFQFDCMFPSLATESYAHAYMGDTHTSGGNPNTGVGVQIAINGSEVAIYKQVAGVQTGLTFPVFTLAANQWLRVRFRRIGTVLFLKAWLLPSAEPAAWTSTYSGEAAGIGPNYGRFMLGLQGGNVAAVNVANYDNVYISSLDRVGLTARRTR